VNYLFRDRLRSIFQLSDTPHQLALAFAVGVFIAFSPTLGLHVLSSILVAWVLRLSKLVLITATFINNPWTIVPLYGFCIWFGSKLMGREIAMPQIAWNELTLSSATVVIQPYLWPFVAGTLVAGSLVAVIAYFFHLSAGGPLSQAGRMTLRRLSVTGRCSVPDQREHLPRKEGFAALRSELQDDLIFPCGVRQMAHPVEAHGEIVMC
jgi:uncharacterized protein (DUF2062 family)